MKYVFNNNVLQRMTLDKLLETDGDKKSIDLIRKCNFVKNKNIFNFPVILLHVTRLIRNNCKFRNTD